MAEQKKLARFLNLIDERIDTQNKIIEKLQSLIKGIIDALLNNPSWEKAYLSSFMQFYSTNSLSWDQLSYTEGEIRNLHYGLIHSFQTIEIDTAFLPKIQQSFIPKQYTLCHAGDVAFADASEDTNEIGKTIEFIAIDSGTVCGLHTIHGRDIKNKTLVGFKGYVLNSRYFHDQIRRLAQGTKVFSITANNLSSCFVYIPELTKQKNIVKLLNAYEELLSTNKILLKQYENQKGYLLQQMFI
jgi:type I restriction enzyme S subunit